MNEWYYDAVVCAVGCRPHFDDFFGPDFKVRMQQAGVTSGVVWDTSDPTAAVAHACVLHTPNRDYPAALPVGLYAHVFTHPKHRRQGHAATVVSASLAAFDAVHPASLLILGTGSPHAAKAYQKHGFAHLAGGLDGGVKGYNPEDVGEWIMVRYRPRPLSPSAPYKTPSALHTAVIAEAETLASTSAAMPDQNPDNPVSENPLS